MQAIAAYANRTGREKVIPFRQIEEVWSQKRPHEFRTREQQVQRLCRAVNIALRDDAWTQRDEKEMGLLLRDLGFTTRTMVRELDESSAGRKINVTYFAKDVEWSVYIFVKATLFELAYEGKGGWFDAKDPVAFLGTAARRAVRDSRWHPGAFGQRFVRRQDRFNCKEVRQFPVRPRGGDVDSGDDRFANDAEYVGYMLATRSDARRASGGRWERTLRREKPDHGPLYPHLPGEFRIDWCHIFRDAGIDNELAEYIRNRVDGKPQNPSGAVKQRWKRLRKDKRFAELILKQVLG